MVSSRESEGGRGKIGIGDKEVQTSRYKIKKLHGCNVQHREHNQYFITTLYGV